MPEPEIDNLLREARLVNDAHCYALLLFLPPDCAYGLLWLYISHGRAFPFYRFEQNLRKPLYSIIRSYAWIVSGICNTDLTALGGDSCPNSTKHMLTQVRNLFQVCYHGNQCSIQKKSEYNHSGMLLRRWLSVLLTE